MKKVALYSILSLLLITQSHGRMHSGPACTLRKAFSAATIGGGALLTLYYLYVNTAELDEAIEGYEVPNQASIEEALDVVEHEWTIAIESMRDVNAMIDHSVNQRLLGSPEQAAQEYWKAAAIAREIADVYRNSTQKLFNLTYKQGEVFGDVAKLQDFILQTCTLSCNTYNIAARLYQAAGDSVSAERVLNAKECIHRISGLHENETLSAIDLQAAFALELKQSLIHVGRIPQETPRGLVLNPDVVNNIEKFNVETRAAEHEAAIKIFRDEL